jgi:hypothetical protein
VFITSLDAPDTEYPKVIPEDVDKCVADATSVREKIGKLWVSLDLLGVGGIACHAE